MKMNMNEWIAQVIQNKAVKALPIMTHPGIELTGHTVREAVTDGMVHYEAIKALSDKYPTAAATVIMDLTVEAEAFGAEVVFADDEVPSVVGRLLQSEADIESLQIPPLNKARIPQYLKANMMAAKGITDRPVFAGVIGPFSLAGRLYDMSEMMMLPYINPEAACALLDKCTEFITRYCLALKATGVNGVMMAEPAAGLLSNDDCLAYSSNFIKRIVEAVQDENFLLILHNCGNTGQCTKAMVQTGAAAYHFGNAIDMKQAIEECPAEALVMGNLDPVHLFKEATPEVMKQATADLLAKCGSYPNFVLSSGCDTPPLTPFANIDAFFRALDEYNG